MKREYGFSLIELLITMCIFVIVITGVIPSLDLIRQKLQLDMFTRDLCEALAVTRNESIFHRQRTVLRNNSSRWDKGWILFVDSNNDGLMNDDEEHLLSYQEISSKEITAIGNNAVRDYISYLPTGNTHLISKAFQAGTITVCHSNPKIAGRKIILSRGGRIRMEQLPTNSPDCP